MIGPMINGAFGSDQSIPDYVVTEACEVAMQGTYVYDGERANHPSWSLDDNYFIYYDELWGGWCMSDSKIKGYTVSSYTNGQTDDPWPPEDGWQAVLGCGPEVPILTKIWILPGPEPSTCPNGDPEIVVTVTGTTGTINWCGETWVLPGDSGVAKTVCPTFYDLLLDTSFPLSMQHVWRIPSELYMRRFYYLSADNGWGRARNDLTVKNINDTNSWSGTGFTWNSTAFNLSVISSVAQPTKSDIQLANEFFGSYTNGGITYAWARGNGW